MKELVKLIKKARFIFICGNGGSASTAEHFTNDLFSKGYRAICLNSNTSIMTMIGNDLDYSLVYAKQLKIYADKGDLLITISCSGTSRNIMEALDAAYSMEMKVFEFPTFFDVGHRDYEDLENHHLEIVHQVKKEL